MSSKEDSRAELWVSVKGKANLESSTL